MAGIGGASLMPELTRAGRLSDVHGREPTTRRDGLLEVL